MSGSLFIPNFHSCLYNGRNKKMYAISKFISHRTNLYISNECIRIVRSYYHLSCQMVYFGNDIYY